MAEPFTMAAIGFQVLGGLFGASAQQRAAARRQAMYNYKARLNEEEAERVIQQTEERIDDFRMQVAQERGQNIVGISAQATPTYGGGKSQSAGAILRANAAMAARDEARIKLAGDRRAEALREEARLNRMGGESARAAGRSQAVATILNTGASVSGQIGEL